MHGWSIPPPAEPTKTAEQFRQERAAKIGELQGLGYLRSERIRQALLTVRREDFIPRLYRDYAYLEVPLPLPGKRATISCPHSYPLFYEPLGLDLGHRFLEVCLGSVYGAGTGYDDITLINADGGFGYPPLAPYDRISVTAACETIPPPLIEQLSPEGRLIAPVVSGYDTQELTLMEKTGRDIRETKICPVLYVALRGRYGA
jgi:protein-L-isoaspartate(D-aspartate) O-methyltransferase